MFGIGSSEFLVIIVVAVLVLGPEHLPRIMRTVTKVMSDFRRISTELQRIINLESFITDETEKQPSTKKRNGTNNKKTKSAQQKDTNDHEPAKDPSSVTPLGDVPANESFVDENEERFSPTFEEPIEDTLIGHSTVKKPAVDKEKNDSVDSSTEGIV